MLGSSVCIFTHSQCETDSEVALIDLVIAMPMGLHESFSIL